MEELLTVLNRIKATGFTPQGIIDVGAYVGAWANVARMAFPESPIFMVEAQPESHEHLQAFKEIAPDFLDFEISLLGPEKLESVDFYQTITPVGSTGSSMYPEKSHFRRKKIELPMNTLDNLMSSKETTYDLLKLDVQGAEIDVLRGSQETLAKIEFIILEASLFSYNHEAPLFDEIIHFMSEAGFMVMDMFQPIRDMNELLFQIDLVFIRKDSVYLPRVTIPRDSD